MHLGGWREYAGACIDPVEWNNRLKEVNDKGESARERISTTSTQISDMLLQLNERLELCEHAIHQMDFQEQALFLPLLGQHSNGIKKLQRVVSRIGSKLQHSNGAGRDRRI